MRLDPRRPLSDSKPLESVSTHLWTRRTKLPRQAGIFIFQLRDRKGL